MAILIWDNGEEFNNCNIWQIYLCPGNKAIDFYLIKNWSDAKE